MSKVIVLILTALFGLFFLALGVSGIALEYQTPPVHTTHLVGFIALTLLGAVLMPGVGTVIFGKIKDGVGLAGPYLPTFGRRAAQGEIDLTNPAAPPPAITPPAVTPPGSDPDGGRP